jgi:glycosyltransferase involved in cell wall biosynthesis
VAIRLGHGEFVGAERAAAARTAILARYGIAPDAVVFGVFGGLTPEKRIAQIVDAFRVTRAYAPDAHLLLAGAPAAHFPLDAYRGVDGVTITGYVEADELTDHVAAVDVSLNLRWPTARETSGPWLRALAAGKPTVVIDLVQLGDVPTMDPRTWQLHTSSIVHRPSSIEGAVAIAIDIVDEDHSLRLAMRRLAADADLRSRLGRAGQEYWQREHTIDVMADDYDRVMAMAASAGPPSLAARASAGQPGREAFAPAGDEKLRALLAPFGIETPW